MAHKFKREEFTKRENARTAAKVPHTPPTSIPDLRDRVYNVEKMLGIDSAEVTSPANGGGN